VGKITAPQTGGQPATSNAYRNTSDHVHGQNHCPNEFQTSYSPDKQDIVYCEECYLAEVV